MSPLIVKQSIFESQFLGLSIVTFAVSQFSTSCG